MYMQALTRRLTDGAARLPSAMRERHRVYLLKARNGDGGFSGREGGSDLYYTAFGLRSLAMLDTLTPEFCRETLPFLRDSLTRSASVIDLFSLLYAALLVQAGGGIDLFADSPADWPERVAATLESFRTADGGYAKAVGSVSGSTYHTFLVGLSYQLLGRRFPRPDAVKSFLLSRRREDGGFVELAPMKRSGTNPTAAAVGALQLLEDEPEALAPGNAHPSLTRPARTRSGVIDLLAALPSPEGGFRANGRIPVADLLSTFTGLWTLRQLNALDRVDGGAARRYAEGLQAPAGGFRGGAWDDATDVEYTFYGLGVLALLAPTNTP